MNALVDDLLERLAPIGPLRAARMFGGVGLYSGELFFAIVWRGAVYFKVDGETRGAYERAGMPAFRPLASKPSMNGYFELPPRVLEHTTELRRWALRSIDVARAAARANSKRPSKPRSKSPRTLRNLGPVSRAWLAEIGVHSRADLERLGSIAAFHAVRRSRKTTSLNLLYALEAALLDVHWTRLPEGLKRNLRAAATALRTSSRGR